MDTRERILQAAGAAFAELGFEATTIREIARRAEVNLASANYHFGDKERLYVETIKYAHLMVAKQVPLPDWPPGTNPQVRLRDFIRTIITRMLGGQAIPWQARLMLRELIQPTGACQELVKDYIRPHFDLLLSILDELLPASAPDHYRHQTAFSIIGQCLFYRVNGPIIQMLIPEEELAEHFALNQIADHITDLTLAALGQTPTAAEGLPRNGTQRHSEKPLEV